MKRDTAIVVYGSLAFGAVLASYSALRPVRDALVLDSHPDQIPWLFTLTFLIVSLTSPAWSKLVGRNPRKVTPLAVHVFAACALGFGALASSDVAPVTVGRAFYVWSAVFNLFVVSITWSLLADLAGPEAARRLYGPISAAGTVGTLVGPALTRLLVDEIGVAGILVLSAVLLEVAVIAIALLARLPAATGEQTEAPMKGGALDGLKHVARSPYLASIVGYVLCTATAATFVYLAQAGIVDGAKLSRSERTELFADIDTWVAVVTIVLQAALARPLLGWFGPGVVLCALPVAQLLGLSALATAPSLTMVIVVAVATRSATHGLTRPARELLFTVVGREDKYKAKNAIDTVAYRFGDFASSWLYKGIDAAGPGALAIASVPLVVGWIVLAGVLGSGFRKRSVEVSHEPT